MRIGTASGLTADTVLWLPFRNGELTDRSASALTVSVGTGSQAPWAPGPYDDAIRFSESTQSLTVTSAAAIAFASSFTIECWLYSEDPSNLKAAITRRGANAAACAWALYAYGGNAQFTVYDTGGAGAVTVSPVVSRPNSSRWMHVRVAVDIAGGYVYLYQDGELAGVKAHAMADVNTTGIPNVTIGRESSTVGGTSQWAGRIAGIRFRSGADTSLTSLDPNVVPDVITRRQFQAVDLDLRETVESVTFTDDTAGGFYVAKSSLTLGSLMLGPDDVREVVETTSGTATTYTAVGNVTDLDAATDSYFFDRINGRLYLSEDPSAADVVRVTVRTRWADRTLDRGPCAVYHGAVASVQPAERRMPYWGELYPAGGGGTVTFAARHAAIPTGLNSEEARVRWPDARVTTRCMSDGLPWAQAIATFAGIVDSAPDDASETFEIKLLHEPARFNRCSFEEVAATTDLWPNIEKGTAGHQWPSVYGAGHKAAVEAVCVDTRVEAISGVNCRRWKVTNQPISTIRGPLMHKVSLADGEIWLPVSYDPTQPVTIAHVDGYPSSISVTDPYTSADGVGTYGDPTDTIITCKAQLQKWLGLFFDVASSEFGSTWAATDGRVAINRRFAEVLTDPAALLSHIKKLCEETFTFLYYKPSTATWEWEDLVKADASQWNLYDSDVIEERWIYDRSKLATRARASACRYLPRADGTYQKAVSTSLRLDSNPKYDIPRETWQPTGADGLTGFKQVSAVDAWLAKARNFLESPPAFHEVTVGARFIGAEQMDVVTDYTSRKPSGLGARFRVLSVAPSADGTCKLVLFSEDPFPTDGTVAALVRDAYKPQRIAGQCFGEDGEAISTGGPTVVNDEEFIFQGDFGEFPPSITHKFQVRAVRSGGAADTDLTFAIRDVTNSQTIATVNCSTVAGFQTATTTFSNIPTGKARLVLRSTGSNGATGTLYSWAWYAYEGASNYDQDEAGPVVMQSGGSNAGITVTTTPQLGWTRFPVDGGTTDAANRMAYRVPSGIAWQQTRFVVYADGASAGTFYLYLASYDQWLRDYVPVVTFGPITTAGFYVGKVVAAPATGKGYVLCFSNTSGTGVVYSVACQAIMPIP